MKILDYLHAFSLKMVFYSLLEDLCANLVPN